MKLAVAIIGFLICVLLGILLSKKFSNKYKFYLALQNFNQDFKCVLSFRREHIEKLLKKDYKFQPFNEILKLKLKNPSQKLYDKLPDFLNDEEKNEIDEYFDKIGKFDALTQYEIINAYEHLFKQRVVTCDTENKKFGSLYKKIGVIIGLIAFIIVV